MGERHIASDAHLVPHKALALLDGEDGPQRLDRVAVLPPALAPPWALRLLVVDRALLPLDVLLGLVGVASRSDRGFLALDTVLLGSIGLGLGLATLRGVEVLVSQGLIIEALLRLEVGDIGDREGNSDAELFNGSLETKSKDRTERREKKERKTKTKGSI